MSAVTELTGRAPSKPGMRAIRLQAKAREAPITRQGRHQKPVIRSLENSPAQVRTAKPKKMIGPQ